MATSRQVRIVLTIEGGRMAGDGSLVTGDLDAECAAAYSVWLGRLSAASDTPALIGGTDETRRQAFVVSTDGAVPIGLPLYGQADFDWDGGAPPTFVELQDYPDGVFRDDAVEDILCYSLTVMTTRLERQAPLSVGGDWAFIDGELETDAPNYPGTS